MNNNLNINTRAARIEILDRLKFSLRDVPRNESPGDVLVERTYRQKNDASRGELVARFVERVAEYKAQVRRVTEANLPGAIAEALAARGAKRLVAPADWPRQWVSKGIDLQRDSVDNPLTYEQLDSCDGILTGCVLAIAQTGTIVLDGGPLQGRRVLSLLPDYHLCVVRTEQIVGLVPEAVTALQDSSRRPMTWISGPSATSDIELNRVEGVHGPRNLEVLVVGEEEEGAAPQP